MTVKEALRFFAGQTKLLEKLAVLDEIGLGYLRLGQSATTLSGGEAQRVKLAAHLSQVRAANANAKPSQASRVLYILDEPTTGLHFDDVSKLLTAFRKLIDGGGSLIVIEHNLDVIKCADWVIDLGPRAAKAAAASLPKATLKRLRPTCTRTPASGSQGCCSRRSMSFSRSLRQRPTDHCQDLPYPRPIG
jgi:excinuclease ABC subunit A